MRTQVRRLLNNASRLHKNFLQHGRLEDTEEAVEALELVMRIAGEYTPPHLFLGFGTLLSDRFKHTGSMDDLDQAISMIRKGLNATPHDDSHQARFLYTLGNMLGDRFKHTGSMDDLDQAISIVRNGLNATPHDDSEQARFLYTLGNMLGDRFKHTGSMDDLDQAISITRSGLDATPYDDSHQARFLYTLGKLLGDRFKHTGSMDDLNQAIGKINDAVDATPYDYPNRNTYLFDFGYLLGKRFERTGVIGDLNQAIRVASDAVDAESYNSQSRVGCLINLGTLLFWRFNHMGSMDDLDRAIILASNALDATSSCHQRASRLGNLGGFLGARFQRTESMSDLNQAICATSDAVDALPDNHPSQSYELSNLSNLLSLRFKQTGSIDDLNQAIDTASDAVDKMSHSYPKRAATLSNLGTRLGSRFEQTGLMDDLNRAISVFSDAVDATPHDHLERVGLLRNLGIALGRRYEQLKSTDDLNRQLSSYIAGWNCINGAPSLRIQSAKLAADIFIQQQDWEKAHQLLHDATSLVPTMSPRSLNHTDTQVMLSDMFGLASAAAAVALQVRKTPGDALCLLELGRDVIASLLMDMRGDVTELQKEHPHLAENFSRIREELDSPAQNASVFIPDQLSSWESQINRRREADKEFSKIIDEIRTQPGFSHFLQPPAVDDLMNTASQGPIIVINISSFRSDAFLIQSGSIQMIELLGLTKKKLAEQVTYLQNKLDLSCSLEWLWHTICRPCLDALGFTEPVSDGNGPHVW
jgi:tetratricopeptide (TPR) repeat protein